MIYRKSRLFLPSFLAAVLLLAGLFSATLQAQNISTAQLNGVVHDQTGAVIANASVTISDESKGFSRTTISDGQGNYRLLLLPPGSYTVKTTAPGFNTVISKNVVLTTGEQGELALTLSVGTTQIVTVSSGADIIETQRSSQSTTVDQLRIENLPTNGRNYINFTLTNSQIARDAAPSIGAIPTSGLNFGGVRARSNSINIDGADASDYLSGGTRTTVSQDAVQEFQIITNGFDAEYGRASGGVVNIITKSGTNATHGSAYGFLRNRYIQATNPFSTVYQPAYTRVQAGFTIGGALIPDKTFYFFSTEITRRQETGFSDIGSNNFGLTSIDVSRFYGAPTGALTVLGTPEQQAFLQNPGVPANTPGIQSYIALVGSGSSLATTGKNPAFLQPSIGVSNFVTSGTQTATTFIPGQAAPVSFVPLNSLIGNFPISEKTEVYSLRIDHKLTNNQQLVLLGSASPSFITGIQESAANQNLGENSFSRTATQRLHDWAINAQDTMVFGNNKVNELRYQFARHPVLFANSNSTGGDNTAVNIPGFAYFGKTPFSIVNSIQDQNQLQDNFTYTHGRHTIKTGVDLRYIPVNIVQGQLYGGGDYTFAALNSTDVSPALAGLPGFSPIQAYGLGIPQSFVQGVGDTAQKYTVKALGAFLQDSWHMTSRMTLNLGVRYDVEAFPTKQALNANTEAAEQLYGIREGIRLQASNVAPRIGIAYDLRGDSKTVLRANYGLFYDRAPGNLEAQSIGFNSTTVPLVILAGGLPCATTSPAAAASPLNLNATNTFQGSLGNANCLGASAAGVNFLASQQRFDTNNTNSLFINQNFLAAGFPLAILPSGLPADLYFKTPYAQQISFGIEQDLGRDMSINVAYNSTGGRHLNRPINVNPVNAQLLTANWRNAVNAVKAGTAAPATASPTSSPLTVATATGVNPCGVGPTGPYVAPPLLNFFRKSGLNMSLAPFLANPAVGGGPCVALASQIANADGIGVGVPVPFGDMTPNLTTGTSNYNGVSVNLKKRFASQYEFLVSYTFSHAIDDSTDVVSNSDAPQSNFAPNAERSNSTFDQRHRFVLSGVYNSGQLGGSGFVPKVFSNFTLAPIFEVSSGRPFNILTGTDTNFDFDPLTDRPNAVAPTSGATSCGTTPVLSKYSPTGAFNLPCYADAPADAGPASNYYAGDLGRNVGTKPYTVFTDLRIARAFMFSHNIALQATVDIFNIINKNNTLDVNLLYTAAGTPTAASDPRQFQFGARISF
ncbi:TonB-dependent receptor domain-containing protein [Tunturiibacter lichenicola]|uniref:carboxypeptidase-like regulatory domain-containing protein n=1 Tax=Tunturiibacter lichenicola TaxID=2051959 RepID=UPI003D9B4D8C